MRYTVVVEGSSSELAAAVQQKINEGWRPTGGVALVPCVSPGMYWLAQAMTLEAQ